MDMITLAMAKAYTDSQRIAYTEGETKTLTWDGDTADIIDNEMLGQMVKMADETMDLNSIDGLTIKASEVLGGKEGYVAKESFDEVSCGYEDGVQFWSATNYNSSGDISIEYTVVSIPAEIAEEFGITEGVYIGITDEAVYISKVHLGTETIHPIDPKYLTTVIDLDEHGIDVQALVLAGGGGKTIDASAIFDSIKRGGNYLFRGSFSGTTVDLPARFYQYNNDGSLYTVGFGMVGNLGTGAVQIDLILSRTYMECALTPLGS